MLYVDSSAYAKRYIATEPDRDTCLDTMDRHERWVTSRLTGVEATRAIRAADETPATINAWLGRLDDDLSATLLVDIDATLLDAARSIVVETRVKTLDAIHLASAMRFPPTSIEFLTYDRRQAAAAARVGITLAQ